MRIIAGRWRGRPLAAPGGDATRPTSDRAREGLFSMLASRIGSFEGLAVADLFAGSGALGLEALSRGAVHCTFVEKDRGALAAIEANLRRLGAAAQAEVRAGSAERAAPPARPCDLLFLDPPYGAPEGAAALAQVVDPRWLAPGGWISFETSGAAPAPPPGLAIEAERRFGKALIVLLRRAE